MSSESVELVRSLHAVAGTDLATLVRDDTIYQQITAVVAPAFAPEFVTAIVMPGEDASSSRTYTGFDGMRLAWMDWLEPWETYRTGHHEFIDVGDRVLVIGHDVGRNWLSEFEIDFRFGTVWTVADGLVTRADFYTTQEQAIEAAGLSDQGLQ